MFNMSHPLVIEKRDKGYEYAKMIDGHDLLTYFVETSSRDEEITSISLDDNPEDSSYTPKDLSHQGAEDNLETILNDNQKCSICWINGDFYKKLNPKLWIECETYAEYLEIVDKPSKGSEEHTFKNSWGNVDEEALKSSEREVLDFR